MAEITFRNLAEQEYGGFHNDVKDILSISVINEFGLQIWQQIERRYPRTKVWRLITPYFEKRNIQFYVNKCGFRIVEFFNRAHRDPDRPISRLPFHDEYFIFEKVMKQQKLFIPENKAAAHSPAGLPARPQQAHDADRTFPH